MEQHFHVELGLLRRLVNLWYVISGLFGGIRDLNLCFPCHSHAFLLSKKRNKNEKKEEAKKRKRKMERKRKVVNEVIGMKVIR